MANWGKLPGMGNVEDRRGFGPAAGIGGTGLLGIIIYLFTTFAGGTPGDGGLGDVLSQLQQTQGAQVQTGDQGEFAGDDSYEQFATKVLGSTDETWSQVFADSGETYAKPKLVLFRTATQSGCGGATSEVGPHYCPGDSTIYLDETFFDELRTRFGAQGGDVAQAYVIAHEVGHHVQSQLGVMRQVAQATARDRSRERELSIAVELQADCFAGVWAKAVSAQGVFEPGEINEAIDAAEAVGDDRIQARAQGQVNPETWTHGSSVQRVEWFNRGLATGRPASCDAFN